MLGKLTSALSSLHNSRDITPPPPPTHDSTIRAKQYAQLAKTLHGVSVPVSLADCSTCEQPCPSEQSSSGAQVLEFGSPWDGRDYPTYVQQKYGFLGEWPESIDTDWDSDLAGSSQGGRGRIAIVSTGTSDWERDHYVGRDSLRTDHPKTYYQQDDKSLLSHHLNKQIMSKSAPSDQKDTPVLPCVSRRSDCVPPSIYSSSLISQSTDPADQTLLVFPDWKVVHELENSSEGAKEIWDGLLTPGVGRSGQKSQRPDTVGRRRSWTLPYRAIILLCEPSLASVIFFAAGSCNPGSHKRRDKRCHIAAPLLRSAFHTVLEKHDIAVDETGSSLACPDGLALEDLDGSDEERDAEALRRLEEIESVSGGDGGEVGIFNINHLGGHRYAGVMLVSCWRSDRSQDG